MLVMAVVLVFGVGASVGVGFWYRCRSWHCCSMLVLVLALAFLAGVGVCFVSVLVFGI